MPLQETLSPLLDSSFLLTLARHLHSARNRLSLRTGGNLPSVTELVFALRLYIARRDRERIAPPSDAPPSSDSSPSTPGHSRNMAFVGPPLLPLASAAPGSSTQLPAATEATPESPKPPPVPSRPPPTISDLAYYLALSDFAYSQNRAELSTNLSVLNMGPLYASSHSSIKWQPGYYLAHDARHARLLLCVRGSRELSDMVTNLSADMETFLDGSGHQGVVRSAHNLHQLVRPQLSALVESHKPAQGIMVVGHSLGGAVASALTMLLRDERQDREFDEDNESAYTKAVFRNAACYAFSSPPFLTKELAERSRGMDITTLVAGFDLVPRLSAASLDRLLVQVSRYNWGRDVGDSLGQAVHQVASSFLQPQEARSVSEAVMEHGVSGLSLAAGAIEQTARAALDSPVRGAQNSPIWSLALNATVFVSSLVGEALTGSQRRALVDERRESEYSFARHFGMSAEDVERTLVENAPADVYLAGVVYHLDRPYTEPGTEVDLATIPPSALVERDAEYFSDIEPSSWMVHDHHPNFIVSALESIQH